MLFKNYILFEIFILVFIHCNMIISYKIPIDFNLFLYI